MPKNNNEIYFINIKTTKMKTKKLFLFALIAGFVFTACSKDYSVATPDDIVNINGSISGTNQVKASIDPYSGLGSFENGDIWGMYATISANHVLNNSEYTVGSTIIYWNSLSETSSVTFSAHYPRITSTITDPEVYMFNAATAANPDLLVATPVTESKSSGSDVNLSFNHVMHQLMINLSKEPEILGNLLDTEVTLLNMKSSAKVNLLTGAVDLTAASGTDSYPMKSGGGTWIVAPQQLTVGDEWIQLKLGVKTYIYRVPADLTQLESGKRVTISLTLKASGDAVAINKDISGWVPQQLTINGDVIGN